MKEVSQEYKDWAVEKLLPTEITIEEGHARRNFLISSPVTGRVKTQFGSFDGVVWSHVMFQSNAPFSCTCDGAGRCVTLIFHLAGTLEYQEQMGQLRVVNSGQHNICFSPTYNTVVELRPEEGVVNTLAIDLPVDYYTRLLSGHSATQERFIKNIESDEPCWLQDNFMSMTMPMKWLINSIRQNQRTGLLKRLFLEAKTLELLMLQVEQAELRLNPADAKSRQRDALYEARTILERNLDQPPTIKTLARMVGINEFNLKKGFKDAFQDTIYGYVSKL